MNNEKLGQDPVFPTPDYVMENSGKIDFNPMGMSKRFYAACAAMQGLISANPKFLHGNVEIPVTKSLAALSYEYADELLKQEHGKED